MHNSLERVMCHNVHQAQHLLKHLQWKSYSAVMHALMVSSVSFLRILKCLVVQMQNRPISVLTHQLN